MATPLRFLLVEDSEDDARLVVRELQQGGFAVDFERVDTAADFVNALDRGGWDLVVADFSLPSFNGREALDILRARGLDTPFVFVSGTMGEEVAVEAMKAGAGDYIVKDRLLRLVPAIQRELREAEIRHQRREAEQALLHTEEQLQQARRLEAIGRLAAGVAHDFNNLLTVVIGSCDLWELRLADRPPPEELTSIRQAVDSAAALTQQLLTFGKSRALQPQWVDLSAVVDRSDRLLRRVLGEHVELTTELAEPGQAAVLGDPGQLEQVIVNLAANARDAMPGGGRLRIELTAPKLDEATAAHQAGARSRCYACLAVTDTGVGMDDDTLDRLFEPFFTTKEPGKGTGLGLATVYGIVTQGGGFVTVDSEPGRGSTFRVYLPQAEGPPPQAAVSEPSPVRGGHEIILVVEDEEAVRRLTGLLLESHGYSVLSAPDGKTALRLATEHRGEIHLLLTDLVMPGMTGPTLAERLAQIRPQTKVLFTSGYASVDALGEEFDLGRYPLLEKPFASRKLAQKVRQVLSSGH